MRARIAARPSRALHTAAEAAARAIAQSEERLRVTIASIGDAVIATDAEGRVTLMNAVAEALTGWTTAEAAGRPLDDIFVILNEESRRPAANPVHRVLRDGVSAGLANHTALLAKDGRETPIDDSAAPIRAADGRMAGVVLVFRDITERRRGEREHAALLAKEHAARTEAERATDRLRQVLAVTDTTLVTTEPEALMRELLARVRLALGGDTATILLIEPDGGHLTPVVSDGLEMDAGERVLIPLERGVAGRIATSDHGLIYDDLGAVEVVGSSLREHVKSLVGAPLRIGERLTGVIHVGAVTPGRFTDADLGLLRLVAERAALAVERARLHAAEGAAYQEARKRQIEAESLAAVARSINTLDLDAALHNIVESACTLLRAHVATLFRVEAESGHLILTAGGGPSGSTPNPNVVVPRGMGLVGLAIERREAVVSANLLADERFAYTPEMRERVEAARHRVGLAVPLLVQGRITGALFVGVLPGQSFSDDDVGLVTTFANQAAVAMANADLYHDAQRANRTKDQFLAMLSHELRQPLNTVLGWVRILLSGRVDQAQQERALETIERNTRAQARMIDDLLDVSRIEAGKMALDRRPISVGPLIVETVESFQQEANAKGVTVTTHLDPSAGTVSADADRLRQILVNLLGNAMKYTPSSGRIEVRLTADCDVVRIVVEDTGAGIEPDVLPHVFERFRQADQHPAGTQGGLGLGLAIVRELVEMHEGTVAARSDGPGRGATFILTLPVTARRETSADDPPR